MVNKISPPYTPEEETALLVEDTYLFLRRRYEGLLIPNHILKDPSVINRREVDTVKRCRDSMLRYPNFFRPERVGEIELILKKLELALENNE